MSRNDKLHGQGASAGLGEEAGSKISAPCTLSNNPLKILMIAPTPYFSDRGCHVRIFEEARALVARGHQVRIVTYHLGRDLEPVPTERIFCLPWYKKHEAGPSWHKVYLDLFLMLKVFGVTRRYKPCLIHAHLHEGVLAGWPVSRIFGIPILFDYQGSLSGESVNHGFFKSDSLLYKLFRWIEYRINRLADFIVTSSSCGVKELKDSGKIRADKVAVFPDGVDTNVFRHYSRLEALDRLGIDDNYPVIMYLGLLNHYQGIDLLLESAKLLIHQGRSFRMVIMGYPEQGYRQKAEQLNISSFVIFTGKIDYADAPKFLAAGDLAVSPKISDTEANGKLLNYISCGLPVVAFDTPVNREILGDDGIYAEPGNALDLATKMSDMLCNREDTRQRGRRLRRRAVEMHGWDIRVTELESIYQHMLTVEK